MWFNNDDRAFAETIRGRDDAALEAQAVGIAKRFASITERLETPEIGRFVAALEQRDYEESLRLWASFDEWARARLPAGADRGEVETWVLSTQTFRDLRTIIEELLRRRSVQR